MREHLTGRSSLIAVIVSASLQTLPIATAAAHEARVVRHGVTRHVRCLDQMYEYQLFAPDSPTPLPAVLLLHGGGGHSADVMSVWIPLAFREHVVLIAPELPRDRAFEAIAPTVFRCIVDDAKQAVKVDAQRVYVFGWSMGGYLTFDTAMFASTYFAGAAVYAAAIGNDYFSILDHAERKTPIAIYIGDQDQHFSLAQVRATRDSLVNHGFPVHYVELLGQDHQLAPVGDIVTRDAWQYLSPFKLPAP